MAIAVEQFPVEMPEPEAGTSLWRDAWRRLLKNRMAVVSGAVLVLVGLLTLLAPGLVVTFHRKRAPGLRPAQGAARIVEAVDRRLVIAIRAV